ncbi:MAG TPA: hypothetical protein DC064_15435 [Cyanobacteria bacterium UBA9273]|nr:hypothetical protein [Cyanobacteria bacterium UBA9273]
MEYWEFLLQKEGDRTWQPLKSPKIELESGRYRVVAHSSRTNTDVEICVTHTCTDEVPPKRRYQKRSRRTNPEGLMVVIPFTSLKPGLWEFCCRGDIMSDFLGKSWQEAIQLQVLPKATEVLPTAQTPATSASSYSEGEGTAEGVRAEILAKTSPTPLIPRAASPEVPKPKVSVKNGKNSPVPIPNPPSNQPAIPTNPILEESLQMLEQILQQVLDPVIQEFEESEPPDVTPPVSPEPELLEQTKNNWQGLILTLDEEALVAKPGEPLVITGQLDVLDVNQLHGSERTTVRNPQFQGTLHYELRHPQTSQLLLEVQKSLLEQTLPLTFNHTLEMPSDSTTCLLLGKVTLYGSDSNSLASQPFTVTADLDKLLGAIQLEEEVISEENNTIAASPDQSSQLPATPLNQTWLNLVDALQNHQPILFSPSSGQSLPPQLNSPESSQRLSKPLQLPNLPKLEPPAPPQSSVELKLTQLQEESQPNVEVKEVTPAEASEDSNTLSPKESHSVTLAADSAPAVDSLQAGDRTVDNAPEPSSQLVAATEQQNRQAEEKRDESSGASSLGKSLADEAESTEPSALAAIADWELAANAVTEMPDAWASPADTELDRTQVTSWSNPSALTNQFPVIPGPDPIATNPTEVDRAFQALNLENRFWSRINNLMGDTELSEWLKFELPILSDPVEEEIASPAPPESLFSEVEEVTPSLKSEAESDVNDFDESIWDEETEEFGSVADEAIPLQPPTQQNSTLRHGERKNRQPLADLDNTDWLAREIVVDDEPLPETEPTEVTSKVSAKISPGKPVVFPPSSGSPTQLELGPPPPAPVMFISTNELVAGEPILLRIKLPLHSARVGVKLWIQDRQSRSLLDGPRWLMDLLPNGSGELEALTQLLVPFGTVEIRFEAIAVDLDSDRESHKASLDCIVVPPDLPSVSLKEFEE